MDDGRELSMLLCVRFDGIWFVPKILWERIFFGDKERRSTTSSSVCCRSNKEEGVCKYSTRSEYQSCVSWNDNMTAHSVTLFRGSPVVVFLSLSFLRTVVLSSEQCNAYSNVFVTSFLTLGCDAVILVQTSYELLGTKRVQSILLGSVPRHRQTDYI